MYKVEQEEPSDSFKKAWASARRHLANQADNQLGWGRSDLSLPLAEHLSFRIGNQIFFIFVEAAEYRFGRGLNLFLKAANEAAAIPCIMPMTEHTTEFEPGVSGWGLIHAETGKALAPLDLVSDELIEMSNWELHDFAIQVVKQSLMEDGKDVISAQSSLHIDPSIWFEKSGSISWVIVRATRYPATKAPIPDNIRDIKKSCSEMGETGYFASVSVANDNDKFLGENAMPLYRGHGLRARFDGLRPL